VLGGHIFTRIVGYPSGKWPFCACASMPELKLTGDPASDLSPSRAAFRGKVVVGYRIDDAGRNTLIHIGENSIRLLGIDHALISAADIL
jgi:hypothetical protein